MGWWLIWFNLKPKFGLLSAIVIAVLSVFELLGPIAHLIPSSSCVPGKPCFLGGFWQSSGFHYALTGLLFLTALTLIFHHSHLQRKVNKYKDLLTFAAVLAGSEDELRPESAQKAAESILTALVRVLGPKGAKAELKSRINATILLRAGKEEEPFRIFAQDSTKPFNDIKIPDDSVAGRVVKFDRDRGTVGTLMYVPSTQYVHAIAFEKGRFSDTNQLVMGAEIVPTTYTVVDETTEIEVLKCLLCIQIPLKSPQEGSIKSNVCAVLSLSGRDVDCLDMVSFSAAKLASALLSDIVVRGC